MDQEYKLRKDVDELQRSVAQNSADIEILRAIPYTRYGTVVKLSDDGKCIVREQNSDNLHYDVVILNNFGLKVGATVVIGFANNSILNPYVIGEYNVNSNLTRLEQYSEDVIQETDNKIDLLVSSPPDAPCVLNAYLTFNGEPYADRPIGLYFRERLVETQVTDANGAVSFTVKPYEHSTYNIKYGDVRTVTVFRNIESVDETVTLTDVHSDIVGYSWSDLLDVVDGKFISRNAFQSFDYRRGKGYIKKGWFNNDTWTVNFTAITGNHANTDGYVLIKGGIALSELTVENQFKNSIGFRSDGSIDVFNNQGERTILDNPHDTGLQWNYNAINFDVTRSGNHYSVHMVNLSNPTIEYSYEFNWDGLNKMDGELHLLMTVTNNYWGGEMELHSPTYTYNRCKAVSELELRASQTVLSYIDGESTTLTTIFPSGQSLSLYNADTHVKMGDMVDDGNGSYSYVYSSTGAGDVTVYATTESITGDSLTIEDCYKAGIQSTDTWHNIYNEGHVTVSDGVASGRNKLMDYNWDNSQDWVFECEFKADTSEWIAILFLDVTNTNQDYNCFGIFQPSNQSVLNVMGRTGSTSWGDIATAVNSRMYAKVKVVKESSTLSFYLNNTLITTHETPAINNVCMGLYSWTDGEGSFKNIKIKKL